MTKTLLTASEQGFLICFVFRHSDFAFERRSHKRPVKNMKFLNYRLKFKKNSRFKLNLPKKSDKMWF